MFCDFPLAGAPFASLGQTEAVNVSVSVTGVEATGATGNVTAAGDLVATDDVLVSGDVVAAGDVTAYGTP